VDHLEIDGGIIVTTLISAAVAFLGWVIRVAARTTLEGLKTSIDAHAKAVGAMQGEMHEFRRELGEFRAEMAAHGARLSALERE
jgi:hypothetical protein